MRQKRKYKTRRKKGRRGPMFLMDIREKFRGWGKIFSLKKVSENEILFYREEKVGSDECP